METSIRGSATATRLSLTFLEEEVRPLDVHPGALVDTHRAGRVLRVHAEADRAEATALELTERVPQERLAEAALTVFGQDTEDPDPAEPRLVLGRAGDHDPGDVLAAFGDEPQRRVE